MCSDLGHIVGTSLKYIPSMLRGELLRGRSAILTRTRTSRVYSRSTHLPYNISAELRMICAAACYDGDRNFPWSYAYTKGCAAVAAAQPLFFGVSTKLCTFQVKRELFEFRKLCIFIFFDFHFCCRYVQQVEVRSTISRGACGATTTVSS